MNAAQTSLYFREWGAVRRHFIEKGLDPKQADNKRHELHLKALGRRMSSKDFRNADLDKVLGVFRAITRPDDLNAQLRVEESEDERKAEAMAGCRAAVNDLWQLGDFRLTRSDQQVRYIAGTARNVIKKEPGDCTSAELFRVLGCLRASVARARAKNPVGAASIDAARSWQTKEEPF